MIVNQDNYKIHSLINKLINNHETWYFDKGIKLNSIMYGHKLIYF